MTNKVKYRRMELHMSQKELSEKCGIPASTLNEIEKQLHEPKVSTAIRIARALGQQLRSFLSAKNSTYRIIYCNLKKMVYNGITYFAILAQKKTVTIAKKERGGADMRWMRRLNGMM